MKFTGSNGKVLLRKVNVSAVAYLEAEIFCGTVLINDDFATVIDMISN